MLVGLEVLGVFFVDVDLLGGREPIVFLLVVVVPRRALVIVLGTVIMVVSIRRCFVEDGAQDAYDT